MEVKLTLSIDPDLVQFARQDALFHKKSISRMFSEFLANHKAQSSRTATQTVSDIVGSLQQYTIDDSKQAIRKAYAKKYSR